MNIRFLAKVWWASAFCAASILTGCGGGGSATVTLSSVQISPAAPTIAKGTSQQLIATAVFSDSSTRDVTNQVAWNSADSLVATVSNTGLAQGLKVGSTTIGAAIQGVTSSVILTVTPATVSRVDITPINASIAKGTTQQFTATGVFSDNTTQNVTQSAVWTSSDSAVATISNASGSNGLAASPNTGALGNTTITATFGGKTNTAILTVTRAVLTQVQVTPPASSIAKGTSQNFTAMAIFSDSTSQNVTTAATWSSSSLDIATISNAAPSQGRASSPNNGSLGTTNISALFNGMTGSTSLTVTPAVLTAVQVTPSTSSIARGTTQQFTATGTYSDASTQNITTSALWASSDAAVATISNAAGSNGLATSPNTGSQGPTTITASFGGFNGSATLTVTPAIITQIQVTPPTPSIPKGTTKSFTATAVYTDSSTQDVTTQATWASTDPNVATVSNAAGSNGVATSPNNGNLGSADISATLNSIGGSTTLTVTTAVLTGLQVTPATPSIAKGTTKAFTATGTYSDNSTQNLTSTVTWSSSAPTIATVSNAPGSNGLASSPNNGAQGDTIITAASGGFNANTTLTVTAAVITAVQVTPPNASIAKGTTKAFSATAVYSDASTQDVTTTATWSSSAPTVAIISNAAGSNGLASSPNNGALGNTTIGAAFGGLNGSTTLTVTAAVLSQVSVTPANASVPAGTSQQYTATAIFTDATTQDVTQSATWASSDTTVAQIGNAAGSRGLAAAQKIGSANISAMFQSVTGSTAINVTAPALSAIQVTPSGGKIPKGLSLQYAATGIYTDGTNKDITTAVAWSTTNPAIATISNAAGSEGLATGAAAGVTSVIAKQGSVTGSTGLTVTAATISSVTVTPALPSVPKGNSLQFTATANLSDSTTMDISKQVAWSSSNTNATISNAAGSQGLAQGATPGSAVITATSNAATGNKAGNTTLTVTAAQLVSINVTAPNNTIPAGTTQNYVAIGTYTDNSTQTITTTVTWISSDTTLATVSNAAGTEGLATAKKVGNVNISATLSGKTGTKALGITAALLTQIVVTPSGATKPMGTSVQFNATGTYSDATTADITTSVTWTSSDRNVAAISNVTGSKGVVTTGGTGQNTGVANIVATQGSISGNTSFTVSPVTLLSIVISPANASIANGTGTHLTATGTYSNNTTQDVTNSVTWSTSNAAIADVGNLASNKGDVRGNSQGTATITVVDPATSVTTNTTINVTAAALKTITITPTNATLPAGFSRQYSATGTFTAGPDQDITSQVTWSTLDTSIATVSNAAGSIGRVSGLVAGGTTIYADMSGVRGQTGVTVTNATLTSISATPLSASIHAANAMATPHTQQYNAVGTFSDNSTLDITTQVNWASSAPNTATIDTLGVAHAGNLPGATNITASKGAVVSSPPAVLTVTAT